MIHNGINFEIIWISDEEFKKLSNNPNTNNSKPTLLVNKDIITKYSNYDASTGELINSLKSIKS